MSFKSHLEVFSLAALIMVALGCERERLVTKELYTADNDVSLYVFLSPDDSSYAEFWEVGPFESNSNFTFNPVKDADLSVQLEYDSGNVVLNDAGYQNENYAIPNFKCCPSTLKVMGESDEYGSFISTDIRLPKKATLQGSKVHLLSDSSYFQITIEVQDPIEESYHSLAINFLDSTGYIKKGREFVDGNILSDNELMSSFETLNQVSRRSIWVSGELKKIDIVEIKLYSYSEEFYLFYNSARDIDNSIGGYFEPVESDTLYSNIDGVLGFAGAYRVDTMRIMVD